MNRVAPAPPQNGDPGQVVRPAGAKRLNGIGATAFHQDTLVLLCVATLQKGAVL